MERVPVRAFSAVPRPLYGLLIVALVIQIAWASQRALPVIDQQPLPATPPAALFEVLALGEPAVLARVLMLWLQGFDYQSGVSLGFADLDYPRLVAWLDQIIDLDADFAYPLLAAARVYAELPQADKQRLMIDFIQRRFQERPAERWQWMAHAVFIAQHRMGDQALALVLARQLADAPAGVPAWARQMHIFVLENMGELAAARVLLGGLLDSGEISDPHEQWFLSRRLHELEQQLASDAASSAPAPH